MCDEYVIPKEQRTILKNQDRAKLEALLASEIEYLIGKGSADGNDAMYPPPKQHPQYPPPKRALKKAASAQYPPPKKKGADPQYPPPKKASAQYPPPKKKASAQYPPPKKKKKR